MPSFEDVVVGLRYNCGIGSGKGLKEWIQTNIVNHFSRLDKVLK